MASQECPVCCDKYTSRQRKRVECGYCHTECCSSCLQKYLLNLQADAQCMGCKRALNGEFLAMHLPRTWLLTTYKDHRERVLLEREMAMLPASQDMLQIYREANRLQTNIRSWDAERSTLHRRLMELTRQITTARNHVLVMQQSNYTQRPGGGDGDGHRERRQFIRACPATACRGFLSTAWRCGTCETWVCKDCGEVKNAQDDPGHSCDPEVAASHAMLQKDSRPCPQCASMIYKTDGCDQMWCTQCNVAFSWRTGAVVTHGIVHNPHYYDWLRRTRGEVPRNPGDVPCGGAPDAWQVDSFLRRQTAVLTTTEIRKMLHLHRSLQHMQHVDLPRLRREAQDDPNRNADLRLRYLLQQLDQNEWRRKLQQREKKRERAFAVMQVYEMFSAAATDVYRALVDEEQDTRRCYAELEQLQEFAKESFDNIAKRFQMAVKRPRDMGW